MKRTALVLFGLTLLIQPVAVSADMVVFWGSNVCDRSTLLARVIKHQTGQLGIEFTYGPGVAARKFTVLCGDKYDEEKGTKTTEVILNSLDKDKKISPGDIFKKAALTGCKLEKE